MASKAFEETNDQMHRSLRPMEPIFGTHVHLKKGINAPLFLVPLCSMENAFFIFLVLKQCFFVKEVPKIQIASGPHHPGWVLGHQWFTLWQLFRFQNHLSIHFCPGQPWVKPSETRADLHYSYVVATSWLFAKIIFSIITWCFIMDVNSHLVDSPPSHRRPSSPFWPKFAGATKKSQWIETFAHCFTLVPSCHKNY